MYCEESGMRKVLLLTVFGTLLFTIFTLNAQEKAQEKKSPVKEGTAAADKKENPDRGPGGEDDTKKPVIEKTDAGAAAKDKKAAENGKKWVWTDIFAFDTPRQKGPDDKKWSFSLGGMFFDKNGNTDSLLANGETNLEFDDNVKNFEIFYQTFYSKVKGDVIENRGNGIVKYDHFLIPRVEFFMFTQHEYNKRLLLKYRNNDGAGLKFVLIRNNYWKLDISGAPVFQYEEYEEKDPKKEKRWSLRFRTRITPFKPISLNYVFFYIPNMTDKENYRYSHDASAVIAMTNILSFKLGYIYMYNNGALPGTGKADTNLYGQISLTL